jgi:hypothetical protein
MREMHLPIRFARGVARPHFDKRSANGPLQSRSW